MRTVADHRAAALALVVPLPTVQEALETAAGKVLAADVVSPGPLPRWDNSAMDGYAVRRSDVAEADPSRPVTLRVCADLPAGTAAAPEVTGGTAARIMTGAPMPPGADAVVPVEHTDGGTVTVRVDRAPAAGAHIRRTGEDVHAGDVVLTAGTVLGARQLAAAASVGCATVPVHRTPRVAVISTGSELVPAGTTPARGQIPDSNSHLLAAAARAAGCDVVRVGAVPDDAAVLRDRLAAQDGLVDVVLTSGGVSVGAYDVVKEVLLSAGSVAFVEVAMQPGKPQGLGRLPGGTPIFCLPGNPVSAFVSFEVFVLPALQRLRGLPAGGRPEVLAVAADGWRAPPGRTQYMPVVLGAGDDGRPSARRAVPGGSGSHLVAGLAQADGFAVVDAGTQVRPGTTVRVMRTDG